jgi:hypothetical protein
MLGRSALLAATNSENYGNWLGNYSDVSLLLRNGTPQLVPFDESPTQKTITATGSASVTTAIFKYGTSALSFAASGGFSAPYSTDLDLAGGDFTIEAWVRLNALPSNGAGRTLVSRYTATARSYHWFLYQSGSTVFLYFDWTTDNSARKLAYASIPTPNLSVFSHYVVVRSGNEILFFVDGQKQTLSGQSSPIGTFFNQPTPLEVGTANALFGADSQAFNGYIDDLRITKIARYETGTGANAGKMVFAGTNTLALPTAQLPANITDDASYNSVSLLLRNGTPGGTLVPFDESPTPKTITAVGDAGISATVFKYGDSSLVFDGADDRLTFASSNDFAFGTGDFTIEFWMRSQDVSTAQRGPLQISGAAGGLSTSYSNGIVIFQGYNGTGNQSGGITAVINNVYMTVTATLSTSVWYHIALTRSGSTCRFFVDGILSGALTSTANLTASNLVVGGYYSTSYLYNGHLDDLRITKGIARYTSNFTPPPAELPNL